MSLSSSMNAAFSSAVVSPFLKRKNHVGLFWHEKVWLLLDWLQVYGLLWNAANPWPWPYLWILWTKWTVWANMDYFSYSPEGALNGGSGNVDISKWGQMEHYLIYAGCFAFPMFALFALFYAYLDKRYFLAYGYIRSEERQQFIKYCLAAAHLLYMPVCLAVFRLYYCDPVTNTLACDRTVECKSPAHIAAIVVVTLANVPLMFGLPYVTYKYINSAVVYSLDADHEKRLQVWELMYMLGIDTAWLDGQMWLLTSFKRQFAYFRLEMLLFKLALLIVFTFVRGDIVAQAALLWLVYTSFCVRYLYHAPYRLVSTNTILKVLVAILMADVSFGLMNAMGTESAVMVASVETIWLLCINVVGLLCIIAVVVLSILNPFAAWPADATLSRIQNSSSDDATRRYVKWICCLHNYNRFRNNWYAGTRSNADIVGLEQLIRLLRKYWLSARAMGSVFTVPIGETLEDLLVMREHVASSHHTNYNPASVVFRRKDFWNTMLTTGKLADGYWDEKAASADGTAAPSASTEYRNMRRSGALNAVSMETINGNVCQHRFSKPHDYSAGESRLLEDILRKRDVTYALMPPLKKRMLNKMLALRALIGNRSIAKNKNMMTVEQDEEMAQLEAHRKKKEEEQAVLKTYKLINALKKVSSEALERVKAMQAQHQENLQKLANAMSPSVATAAGTGAGADSSASAAVIGASEDETTAQLVASYDELCASLEDLVGEWSDVLGLLENNELPGVPTVLSENASISRISSRDLDDEDAPTLGRRQRSGINAETAAILKKNNLTPYTMNDTEEWYTYRAMLQDRLEQVNNALNSLMLPQQGMLADDYSDHVDEDDDTQVRRRNGSYFSDYFPSPVEHHGAVAILKQLDEVEDEETQQRLGLMGGAQGQNRSKEMLPLSEVVMPSNNTMVLDGRGRGAATVVGAPPDTALDMISPVDHNRSGSGSGLQHTMVVDEDDRSGHGDDDDGGYHEREWGGGDDDDAGNDDNV